MTDEISDIRGTLQFLHETPAKISKLIEGLSEEELQIRGSNNEFSMLETICHLRDLEREGYGERVNRILGESNPSLSDFDGARVAAERNYHAENPTVALQDFAEARARNLLKLKTASAAELKRTGILEGVGTVSLAHLAEMMREHDGAHLEEMNAMRVRINARRKDEG